MVLPSWNNEPFTPQHQCAYSTNFSLHICSDADKENFFNNREFLELVMIFIIHVSSMIVVGVILQGVNVSFNDAPLLQRNKMAPTAVVSENLCLTCTCKTNSNFVCNV